MGDNLSRSYTQARKCSMRWHTRHACPTWPCRRGSSLYMCVCRHKHTLKPEVPQYWIPSHESTAPIFIIPDPTIPTSTISTHEPLLYVGGLVERQDEGERTARDNQCQLAINTLSPYRDPFFPATSSSSSDSTMNPPETCCLFSFSRKKRAHAHSIWQFTCTYYRSADKHKAFGWRTRA